MSHAEVIGNSPAKACFQRDDSNYFYRAISPQRDAAKRNRAGMADFETSVLTKAAMQQKD